MADNKSLVSIGLPVYNTETNIRKSVESILAQDYEHFELIISDNASTDATQDICLEYAERDKRVRYYRNERNIGIAMNMNRVLELSSGEYFKWAGSHDYVAPSFISACKQVLDNDPRVVLAYPLARYIDGKGETMTGVVPEIIDTRGLPTFARAVVVVAKVERCAFELYGLFRMAALKRCRPLRKLVQNDMVLMLEISILGTIALVPEVLFYRRDFGPVWTGDEAMTKAMLRVDPGASNRKNLRPIWTLGIQQLAGAWRLTSLIRAFYLLPLIAHTHYSRWRGQLKRELRNPYSLDGHKEVEF